MDCEVLAIVKTARRARGRCRRFRRRGLDHTSFYGDSGGQVGDTGVFVSTDGNVTVAGS